MHRDEQIGPQPPRDAIAFLKHQETVVRARQRNAHAARGKQVVADRTREREGNVLFALAAVRADCAGVVPAVPASITTSGRRLSAGPSMRGSATEGFGLPIGTVTL